MDLIAARVLSDGRSHRPLPWSTRMPPNARRACRQALVMFPPPAAVPTANTRRASVGAFEIASGMTVAAG